MESNPPPSRGQLVAMGAATELAVKRTEVDVLEWAQQLRRLPLELERGALP